MIKTTGERTVLLLFADVPVRLVRKQDNSMVLPTIARFAARASRRTDEGKTIKSIKLQLDFTSRLCNTIEK